MTLFRRNLSSRCLQRSVTYVEISTRVDDLLARQFAADAIHDWHDEALLPLIEERSRQAFISANHAHPARPTQFAQDTVGHDESETEIQDKVRAK